MPPTYYRGCWHVVSRDLFLEYRHYSSPRKGVYNPKAFIPHAASLRQAFAHCAKFLAAASRRSQGRVSVPVWLAVLSDQLPVLGLVGRYLTNYLIGRKPLLQRADYSALWCLHMREDTLCGIRSPFDDLFPTYRIGCLRVIQPFATIRYFLAVTPDRSTCMHKARRQRLS